MTIYVMVLLLVWPLARTVDSLLLKLLFALTPVVPMFYMFVLMARRIRSSDELEQRMHLIALGVASAVVGALSLIGGFLAAAHVLTLDGSVLIWVFPVMLTSYGIAHLVVVRRYGGEMFACAGNSGLPLHIRAFYVATLIGAIAVWAYLRRDNQAWGMLLGMAAVFLVVGVARLIQRRHRARLASRSSDSEAAR
ncbi:MAG: hypothetical protein ABI767_04635 [Rhodanobacter sp.]